MRVAITGARGRLGRALVTALEESAFTGPGGPAAWGRARLDLDHPGNIHELLAMDRVEVLVHAAAWTDVDGCAREPALAARRNGEAAGVIAGACAARGIDLVLVSTNEVFDGRRTDWRGYEPEDPTSPANPYGSSKLAGEVAATRAYAAATGGGRLAIVRTAWLYGPPGNDYPARILEAGARAANEGRALRVVGDEVGTPTYAPDVADVIAAMIGADAIGGIHHVVNAGLASRVEWAAEVLASAGMQVPVEVIKASEWKRDSPPPLWAVLAPTADLAGEPMRPWREAFAEYLPTLLRGLNRPRAFR